MAKVAVLAAVHINLRRVNRRLTRAGYTVTGMRVSRVDGPDEVQMAPADLAELGDVVLDPAARLLGFRPRDGIRCTFDGRVAASPAWPIVVDIARAVAAEVPLAVVDDGAGTSYLTHPVRGLIGPDEYEPLGPNTGTGGVLRWLLGNRR